MEELDSLIIVVEFLYVFFFSFSTECFPLKIGESDACKGQIVCYFEVQVTNFGCTCHNSSLQSHLCGVGNGVGRGRYSYFGNRYFRIVYFRTIQETFLPPANICLVTK